MPITLPDDYWIEIPGGRYTLGLLPDEARRLAVEIAGWVEAEGIVPTPNDWKNMARVLEIEEETGNPAWVEKYLLARYPAREVEIAPYAIARRPVTVDIYRRFMAETGESEPDEFGLPGLNNDADDRPARGVAWPAALKLARWAGARLPFEAEWERAARGLERRLYPWGDTFRPVADYLFHRSWDDVPALVPRTATPDGIEGMLNSAQEICLDLWTEALGFDPAAWRSEPVRPWARVTRGDEALARLTTSAVAREPMGPTDNPDRGQIRLVRADGRAAPPAPPMPRSFSAAMEVRAYEHDVLAPILRGLAATVIGEHHDVVASLTRRHKGITFDLELALGKGRNGSADEVGAKFPEPNQAELDAAVDPRTRGARLDPVWCRGLIFIATSRETLRRAVPEHGIFLWSPLYRVAEDGRLRARAVSVFRMAYDQKRHRFEHGFVPDEPDTALDDLTPELIRRSVLDAFAFYDAHADADRAPPGGTPG